jgi:hypothetical protein
LNPTILRHAQAFAFLLSPPTPRRASPLLPRERFRPYVETGQADWVLTLGLIRRRAFDTEALQDGSAAPSRPRVLRTTEVRGSNPLSSTR